MLQRISVSVHICESCQDTRRLARLSTVDLHCSLPPPMRSGERPFLLNKPAVTPVIQQVKVSVELQAAVTPKQPIAVRKSPIGFSRKGCFVVTIDDLIKHTQQRLKAARDQRADHLAAIRSTVDKAKREGRSLSESETTAVDSDRKNVNRLNDEIVELDRKLDEQREMAREELEIERLHNQRIPTGVAPKPHDQVVRVSDPELYQKPGQGPNWRDQPNFLKDLYQAQIMHDPGANARLERHGRMVEATFPNWQERAVATGAVSGFVPPQWMSELFAELARAGRPVANQCQRLPLPPEGMTFNVPRVTTGTVVQIQATEGGAIGNQDLDDTLLPVPVATIAGHVDVSYQALLRGVIVEELLFSDLAADYNAKLDTQVISGSGSSGQHLGILNVSSVNAVTYTDATPTIPELWPKLADAVGQVMSQRFTGPTTFVMRPNAWAWILAERDTTGRPLVEPEGVAFNPAAISTVPNYERNTVGSLFGVPVVLSGNVPNNLGAGTNETRIIAADFRDIYLFEEQGGNPVQLRFDAPGSATLISKLVAYGFSALASGRQPKAISVISGTGLVIPAL